MIYRVRAKEWGKYVAGKFEIKDKKMKTNQNQR
jgi:hypothetical protein